MGHKLKGFHLRQLLSVAVKPMVTSWLCMSGFFQEFFGGGGIYCYASFSTVFEQTVFVGAIVCEGRANCFKGAPPCGRKPDVLNPENV